MDYNNKNNWNIKKNRFIKHCYNVIQKIFALNYCMLTNNYPAHFLNLLQVLLQMHEYFTKIYYRRCFLQLPETFHMKLSGFLHCIFPANQKNLTRTCNSVSFSQDHLRHLLGLIRKKFSMKKLVIQNSCFYNE